MRDGIDVSTPVQSKCVARSDSRVCSIFGVSMVVQIAISAGHEFIVTTEAKYAEICDDKMMYLDYVSLPSEV